MKNLQKLTLIGLASIITITLSGCTGAETQPETSTTNTNVKTVLPGITLPSSFYDLTTTDKIIINDTTINIEDDSLSTSDLATVPDSEKYVIKFSDEEKWVQLETGSEDITNNGIVKNMEPSDALNDEATKSLQSYLADDNYYHIDLWHSTSPDVGRFKKGVTDNTIKIESVKLNTPSPEDLKALTAEVKFVPYSEKKSKQAHTEINILPTKDAELNFSYKYADNGNIYEDSSANVSLSFYRIAPLKNITATPVFEWKLERVTEN